MKRKRKIMVLLAFASAFGVACRQDYSPPASSAVNTGYLVADGFINSGPDSMFIMLSRTRSLTAGAVASPENSAHVIVEGDAGFSSPLVFLGNGKYGAGNFNLANTQKYRINISTSNGSNYVSDFVQLKPSPVIDSISWQRSDTGVAIFANTHDPSNNSFYYRWEYGETWEYHSVYESFTYYNPVDTSIFATFTEQPHTCWDSSHSTDILIASSAKLSQDLIYRAPLQVIPLGAEKLSVRYSLDVKQYALTADAYNYWETLKKSTEQGGTPFDQEPTQIKGNLHCITHPNEPAIGYVGAGSITRQRIFIDNSQVAPWSTPYACGLITLHSRDSLAAYENTGAYRIVQVLPPGRPATAWVLSSDFCVDCSARRGTTIKPTYW
jgi:hypothetical protein